MKRLTIVIALGLTSSGAAWPQRSPDLATAKDLERLKAEYGGVLALQGTSRDEVFAIARLLRAKPEMAIDQIRNSREYCLKSGQGTMTHYASDPTQTRRPLRRPIPLLGCHLVLRSGALTPSGRHALLEPGAGTGRPVFDPPARRFHGSTASQDLAAGSPDIATVRKKTRPARLPPMRHTRMPAGHTEPTAGTSVLGLSAQHRG